MEPVSSRYTSKNSVLCITSVANAEQIWMRPESVEDFALRRGCGSTLTCADWRSAGSGQDDVTGKVMDSLLFTHLTFSRKRRSWLIGWPTRLSGESLWSTMVCITWDLGVRVAGLVFSAIIHHVAIPFIFTTAHFPKILWIRWLRGQLSCCVTDGEKLQSASVTGWPSLLTTQCGISENGMLQVELANRSWLTSMKLLRVKSAVPFAGRPGSTSNDIAA